MSNLERAKKTYEAMNFQLVEELPVLTKHSSKIFFLIVKNFFTITNEFIRQANRSMKKIVEVFKQNQNKQQ